MPPTKEQVLAAIEAMCDQRPGNIFSERHLIQEARRQLRTTTAYTEKQLDILVKDGRVKRIPVSAFGSLLLTEKDDKKLGEAFDHPCLTPERHVGAEYGPVTVEHIEGSLWSGTDIRSYYTTAAAWAALRPRLEEAAQKAVDKRREEREIEKALENVAVEAAVPGYAEIAKTLSALLPGVKVETSIHNPDSRDPFVCVRIDGLRVSGLKQIVEVLQRGLA